MMESMAIAELQRRVAKLERTVTFLLDQLHIKYVDAPPAGVSPEVFAAVQKGNKIEAIKIYREQTGLGLKEAKDFIDSLGL